MPDRESGEFADRVIAKLQSEIESFLYYPHPFTKGGFVILFKDHDGSFLDRVSDVYLCRPPAAMSLHLLRPAELFQLAMPGSYALPNIVNEHSHLAFSVKHKGLILHGRDIRPEIPLSTRPAVLLDSHIEGCAVYLRSQGLLRWLADKEYLKLLDEVDKNFRYLMASALLQYKHWDVAMETLPEDFARYFGDGPALEIWKEFNQLRQSTDAENQASCRSAAFESVWLFETFLGLLRTSLQ